MSPEEREAMRLLEKRIKLELELEKRKNEMQIQKLQEKVNPTLKTRLSQLMKDFQKTKKKVKITW